MPSYVPAPPHTFSLSRLRQAWPELSSSTPFWIGARVRARTPEGVLLGSQGLSAMGPASLPGRAGDLIAVRVRRTDVTIAEGGFRFDGFLEALTLAEAQCEPRPWTAADEGHRRWRAFREEVEVYLQSAGLSAVETPSLVVNPGMEPQLEPFSSVWRRGRKQQNLFLPTSPELHLKKLLARGWSDIYEMKWCFRNDELSPVHQPEFLMLEWYRAYARLDDIVEDLTGLLRHLAARGFCEPQPDPEVVTVRDLFKSYVGLSLTPETGLQEMRACARDCGLEVGDSDWDDIFHWLFVERIEPHLDTPAPLIVRDYPPSQAALARLTPQGWGDRFELYWRGLEIANAFHELNDPVEQRRRFAADGEKRARLGRTAVPVDDEFLRALDAGLPPSGGIALGMERLYLACTQAADLARLRLFPYAEG